MIISSDKKLNLEEIIEFLKTARNGEQIIIKEGKKYIKFKPERRKDNPDADYIKIDEINEDPNITEQKRKNFFGLDFPYYLKIKKEESTRGI
jgi:hypothetical protein